MNDNTVKTPELPEYSKYLINEINAYQHKRDGWKEGTPNFDAYDLLCRVLRQAADKYIQVFTPQSAPVSETTGQVEGIKENARLYAEGKMIDNWDRKDHIMIGIFYQHYIEYILTNQPLPVHKVDAYVRPNIKDFFPPETDLLQVMEIYGLHPDLFKYAQALDNYIDDALQPVSTPAPQEVPPAPANEGVDVKNISQQGEQC